MQCDQCGKGVPTTTRFCAYCGAPIQAPRIVRPPRAPLPTWARWVLGVAVVLSLVVTATLTEGRFLKILTGSACQMPASPTPAEDSVIPSVPAELMFLDEHAGLTAYLDLGTDVNVSQAKEIYGEFTEVISSGIMSFRQVFSGEIMSETDDFIVGRIALPYELDGRFVSLWDRTPNAEGIRNVSVFIHRRGWIAAYYPEGVVAAQNVVLKGDASLAWDITSPLKYGIQEACRALGLDADTTPVRFHDFSRPAESGLTLIVYTARQTGISSFDFFIPSEMTVTSGSWFHAAFNTNSRMAVSGDNLSTVRGIGVGRPLPVARGQLKQTHLKPGDYLVSLTVEEEDRIYRSHRAFVVIAVYYRGEATPTSDGARLLTLDLERPCTGPEIP